MILVTGATGRVGYHLMEALADAKAEVTAMVRVEARAADLPGTPQHVVASFDEPPSADVLRRFDRIFLLSPEVEEQAELETVFLDAVAAAGHRPHVVKVAADGFDDPGCEVRFALAHRQVTARLEALGLPASYLAPAPYMEDLTAWADVIRETGTLAWPGGHGSAGWVAAADVATAAARLLTEPSPEAGTFVLTGPEKLTGHQVAARFTAVFAQQVEFREQTPERAREFFLGRGLTPWAADGAIERFTWIGQDGAGPVTDTVAELTGAQPQPLQAWLAETRQDFLT